MTSQEAGVGTKRSAEEASLGDQSPAPKKQMTSLQQAAKQHSRPAASCRGTSSKKPANARFSRFNRVSKTRAHAAFTDVNTDSTSFNVVLLGKPRSSDSSKFAKFPSLIPINVKSMLQVPENIARITADDPSVLRMCKYIKIHKVAGDKGTYVPMMGAEHELSLPIGSCVDFSRFYSEKPPVDDTDYPLQGFCIANLSGVRGSDTYFKKSGNTSVTFAAADVSLVMGPQEKSVALLDQVYSMAPTGMVYYRGLTLEPPAQTVDEETTPLAGAPPLSNGGGGGGEGGPSNGDNSSGSSNAPDPGFSNPGQAPESTPSTDNTKKTNTAFYNWLDNLPMDLKPTHLRNIIFVELTPPFKNPRRGVVHETISYDEENWVRKYKVKDSQGKESEVDMPYMELVVYGHQWDDKFGVSDEQPEEFLLRLNPRKGVVCPILGSINCNTWKQLAPAHTNPNLGTRFAFIRQSEAGNSYAVQSDTTFGRDYRKNNKVDTAVHFSGILAGFDIEGHLASYGWPITRAAAMDLMRKKFGKNAKGEFIPSTQLDPAVRDMSKGVQVTFRYYHPDVVNMFETTEKITVIDEMPGDANFFVVLTPKPRTRKRTRLMLEGGSAVMKEGIPVFDKCFKSFSSELAKIVGLGENATSESIILYMVNKEAYVAAETRTRRRRIWVNKLWDQAEKERKESEAEAGSEGEEEEGDGQQRDQSPGSASGGEDGGEDDEEEEDRPEDDEPDVETEEDRENPYVEYTQDLVEDPSAAVMEDVASEGE